MAVPYQKATDDALCQSRSPPINVIVVKNRDFSKLLLTIRAKYVLLPMSRYTKPSILAYLNCSADGVWMFRSVDGLGGPLVVNTNGMLCGYVPWSFECVFP